jgi:hypothetical protein
MAFPIVFITFNIFVFPIAWGGNILLKEKVWMQIPIPY